MAIAGARHGGPAVGPRVHGAAAVAAAFEGQATAAQPAVIDGQIGFAWAPRGVPRALFRVTVADGLLTAIDVVADPTAVGSAEVVLLDRL